MSFHKYCKTLFLIAFLFLTACQGFKFDPWPESPYGIHHTVQKGQTLYRIAQVYEIDMEVLRRANHIRDASNIKVGSQLWIPGASRVRSVPTTSSSSSRSAKKKNSPTVRPRKGVLVWPAKGTLTSGFGKRNGRQHEGIDIAAPKGTPIYSAAAGEVVFSGWGPTGYGKMVIIKHQHHLTTVYAHNSKILVKKGTRVKQGQKISLMGSTGRSTGPHLHFEVRNDTKPKNPIKYLPMRR
ncbi:MAG: M23 family metallopeptidase [Nitrospina sp.]|jgi:murein DD-endopeptidase MepM/ murein hydrolase activator NlpD|nr:M23 family metallopeptidase [Nitrospina sp.]